MELGTTVPSVLSLSDYKTGGKSRLPTDVEASRSSVLSSPRMAKLVMSRNGPASPGVPP